MISQETIENVKAKVQIVDVISDYLKLKRQGVNHVGLCPFHNEKSPSFTVSGVRGNYKCFGCGKSGDAIQFIIEHERKGYQEAIEILARKYNIEIEESKGKKEFVKPIPKLEKMSRDKIEYFESRRGISNNTLLRAKVTEAKEWMPQSGKEELVICFNYFIDDELVNIKFRGPKKSFKLAKDAKLVFYNLDGIKGYKEAVIVEGEVDTLTLIECGIYNVIGVPNGTPPKGSIMNLEYLNNCWEYFTGLETVVIAVDDDEVGRNLKEELGRRIGKERCRIVRYPEGCKDSNEVLLKFGKQAVVEMVENAIQWPIEGIVPMEDQIQDVISYYEEGYPMGLDSKIEGLDSLITFFPGHLTMITGIPGHGKDEFANELMVSLSRYHRMVWAVFNFEEPPTIHTTKLIEKYSRKAFAFRKDQGNRLTREQLGEGLIFVQDHFHQANVGDIDVTMDGIIEKSIELVLRYGVNGIIINPWNYLEHKKAAGQSETDYVSEVLTKLCNFLWKYGVHCLLVAHPTKIQKNKTTDKYEVPTLYSISGSAHFFNKTHNGICIYRDYQTNTTDVYVQKVKWYWLGQIGWVSYRFNTETRQYEFSSTSVVQSNWKPLNPTTEAYNANLYIEKGSRMGDESIDDASF